MDAATLADNGYRLGDRVRLTFPNGPGELTIAGVYAPAGPYQGFVDLAGHAPGDWVLGTRQRDLRRALPGADPEQVRADLERRLEPYPVVQLQDQVQFKQDVTDQVNQVLGFLFALLALAVLIAFLGIVNTLLLSVVERTRELGLLRAIGSTRSQVRAMIVVESLLIAVFGAVLGVAVGLLYGALLQRALEPEGVTELAVPWGQLLVFVVLGGVGGVLAALWPAWRASRLNMLRAIATE